MALDSRVTSLAWSVVSPVRVLNIVPLTPSMSPRSRSSSRSNCLRRISLRSWTCSLPEPSRRSTKAALPIRRSAVMRPATVSRFRLW